MHDEAQQCDSSMVLRQFSPETLRDSPAETLRDRILEATAAAANALLTVNTFTEAVETALQIVGECLDTDRIAVIENFVSPSNASSPCWRIIYEWDSPGTVSQLADPHSTQGSYSVVQWLYELLQQGQTASYRIEEAPEPFRSQQRNIGVKSTHLVPIFAEGHWWGVLGLDDCREAKQRSAAELAVLKIAANCIGSAIQRDRTQQARVAELARANAELQQHEYELQQRDRLLSVVAQVTKNLLETENIDVAIPAALRAVGEVATMSRVLLHLERSNPITQRLEHCVAYEWTAEGISTHQAVGLDVMDNEDYQVLLQPMYQGQSIWRVIDDLPDVTRQPFERLAIQSTGVVPVFVEGRYIGCVAFDDCVVPRQWNQQEIDVLTAAAESIGAALHRRQLVDRLVDERIQAEKERTAELKKANEALARTSQRLAEQPDLSAFLSHVALEAIAQLGADSAMLSIVDEDRQVLRMAAHVDQRHSSIAPLTAEIPVDEAVFMEVLLKARRPRYFNLEQDSHLFGTAWVDYHHQRNHQAMMGVPLFAGGNFLGHLGLAFTHTEPIKEQDSELLHALAQQAALAIQLTRLADEAKQAAVAKLNEAIAREQEKAAQERATELSRANTLLRNSLSSLSTNPNLQDVLGHLLIELVRYAGAVVGHIFIHDSVQNTLALKVRCRHEQTFWTPAADEPALFRAPIPIEHTPIFTRLLEHPRLAVLNDHEFDGRLWQGVGDWFQAKGYRGTCSCVLMVGDRSFGMLAMAFPQPVAFRPVEEELILALTQQIALVIQLTLLGEADKQTALAKLNEVIAREQERAAQARVTELAKANDALKHSLDRLAQECDLDAFLGHVLREIANQVQASAGHIFLLNTETNTLDLRLEIHNGQLRRQAGPDEPSLFQFSFPADITPAFQYLCQKRTLSSWSAGEFDGMTWAGIPEWFEQEGFTEAVGLALIVGDQPVGLLGLAFYHKSTLKPEEAELIHALAHQATLAIQMTQLGEKAKQTAVLKERNRMAREIHDTIAQGLTGILIQLQAAEDVDLTDAGDRQAHVAQARHLAEVSLAEARRSVQALRPQVLEETNLAGALSHLMDILTASTDVQVTCEIQGPLSPLPADVETNLLRIAQEATNNTLKHAQASQIQIELSYHPDRVQMRMQDNGRGFDRVSLDHPGHDGKETYGLISMQERSQQIGGRLTIDSQIGEGTTITIVVPLAL